MSDLSALLDREASAEIETLLSEARARASEIAEEASAEAELLLAQRRRTAESHHDATLVRAQSSARLEASALKLRAQHAAVEGVFATARARLDELASDPVAYERVLRSLLTEAVEAVGVADVEAIHAAPSDVSAVTKIAADVAPQVPVSPDPDLALGVRVVTTRHSTVENALPQRLEALRGELAATVSELLFAPAPAA